MLSWSDQISPYIPKFEYFTFQVFCLLNLFVIC